MGSSETPPIDLLISPFAVDPLTPMSLACIVPFARTRCDRLYWSARRRWFTWPWSAARFRSAVVDRVSRAEGSWRSL